MQSRVRYVSQPDTDPSESRKPAAVRRASANGSATVASTCSGSASAAEAVGYKVLRQRAHRARDGAPTPRLIRATHPSTGGAGPLRRGGGAGGSSVNSQRG